MSLTAFFRRPEVQELLTRASRCSAVPVSVHFVSEEDEGLRIFGHGSCVVCRHAYGTLAGKEACRASRFDGAHAALMRNKPTPFLCHLGLVCTSVRAVANEGFVITFGPYGPSEAPDSLEADVRRGLAALDVVSDDPPELQDIRLIPADAVPEIAAWTVEELMRLWEHVHLPEPIAPEEIQEETLAKGSGRGKVSRPVPDHFEASVIAVALVGGEHGKARELVGVALSEASSSRRPRLAIRRARVATVVTSTLEAAERAGVDTSDCLPRFSAFLDENGAARTDSELVNCAMKFLGFLKRQAAKPSAKGRTVRTSSIPGLRDLNRLVMGRLSEGVTLNEVADELGEHPTAITHRLQRKFGMSFSEYLGRLRVGKSKELLRRTKLGIGEVGRRIGIKDTSNFGRLFRKHEGMTPVQYRERFGRKK